MLYDLIRLRMLLEHPMLRKLVFTQLIRYDIEAWSSASDTHPFSAASSSRWFHHRTSSSPTTPFSRLSSSVLETLLHFLFFDVSPSSSIMSGSEKTLEGFRAFCAFSGRFRLLYTRRPRLGSLLCCFPEKIKGVLFLGYAVVAYTIGCFFSQGNTVILPGYGTYSKSEMIS